MRLLHGPQYFALHSVAISMLSATFWLPNVRPHQEDPGLLGDMTDCMFGAREE